MSRPSARITFDAHRLLFPTQRRFNAAWMETRGGRVRILPRVLHELTHQRFDATDPEDLADQLQEAKARLRRSRSRLTPRERMQRQAAIWWLTETLAADSPYELVRLTADERERVHDICQAIPADYFPRTAPEEVPEDGNAILIAEALVSGETLLLTGNMHAILHHSVNEWSADNQERFGLPNSRGLHHQDHFMPRAFARDDAREQLCGIALAAAWPDDPQADIDAIERNLHGALKAMHRGAALTDTATCIAETWRTTAQPERILEDARRHLPQRMRASERRHPAHPANQGTVREAADPGDAPAPGDAEGSAPRGRPAGRRIGD